MKQNLLFTGLLLFFAFGCNKEDDIIPSNQLQGKYEFKLEKVGNNYEMDFVNTLDFKSDGTVYGEAFTTKAGTEEVLGYRYYFNGEYEIEDEKVTITSTESFHNNLMDTFFAPKRDLVYEEGGMASEEYFIKDEFQTLQIICPANVNCLNVVYKKLN